MPYFTVIGALCCPRQRETSINLSNLYTVLAGFFCRQYYQYCVINVYNLLLLALLLFICVA